MSLYVMGAHTYAFIILFRDVVKAWWWLTAQQHQDFTRPFTSATMHGSPNRRFLLFNTRAIHWEFDISKAMVVAPMCIRL